MNLIQSLRNFPYELEVVAIRGSELGSLLKIGYIHF